MHKTLTMCSLPLEQSDVVWARVAQVADVHRSTNGQRAGLGQNVDTSAQFQEIPEAQVSVQPFLSTRKYQAERSVEGALA